MCIPANQRPSHQWRKTKQKMHSVVMHNRKDSARRTKRTFSFSLGFFGCRTEREFSFSRITSAGIWQQKSMNLVKCFGRLSVHHISDSKLYSGVELRPWTFQWDLTLHLLIWTVLHINRYVHQWYADIGMPFHWNAKHSKLIALFLSPFSSLKGYGTVW